MNIVLCRTLTILLCLLCAAAGLRAQLPGLAWDKTIGGDSWDELTGLLTTTDGMIVAGSSRSGTAFGNPNDYSWNFLILKLDLDGNVVWKRTYGGDQDDRLWEIIPTSDGGFLAGGYSFSGVSGNKSQPSRGDMDVWVIKLDGQGQLQWEKAWGGLYRDELFALLERPGGGYLLGCNSWSEAGPDKTEACRGQQDFWLIGIDAQGNKLWDKTIGGDGYDQINDLEWASDGGVYLAGGTVSAGGSGDLGAEPERGGMDFWLGKFDPGTRQLLWDHRYGGTGEDYPYALLVASGKLYWGGRSGSAPAAPGPFNNGKDAPFYGGDSDYWLLELDGNGQKLREWSFGGTGLDDLYSIHENVLGQLILGGVTDSGISGSKTAPSHGNYDYWLIGLDPDSGQLWERTVGGADNDALTRTALFSDGSLVIGGHSRSNTGFEKTENNLGVNDFWVVYFECDLTANIIPSGPPSSCSSDPVFLNATVPGCSNCQYTWNTGSHDSGIEVPNDENAAYSVLAYDERGCIAADTILIEPALPPQIDLGSGDTLVVQGQAPVIGSADPAFRYLWSTGDTTGLIRVTQAGLYSVTFTDAAGCTGTGQIRVKVVYRGKLWVPNVFSPDFNGYNDYACIFTDESVRRVVTFQVADRWGTLMFRRDDFFPGFETDGWDGVYRNKPAPPGVYGWFAEIEYTDGSRELFEGSVTIVR